MAVPELTARSPFVALPAPRILPRLAGVGIVVLSLACMGFMVRQAEKSAGLVADKGTLVVKRCEERGRSGGRYSSDTYDVCFGSFQADSGRAMRDGAWIRGWYVVGEKVRVYREGDRCQPVSWRFFWGRLAFFFAGLMMVAFGLMTTVVGHRAKTAEEIRASWEALRRTSAGPYVSWLLRTGGAGTAACTVLSLVWS
ncbi:hypothetical protein [Streptomyces roseoverticillatus]|uniref:hypothetical protein n=1 Tax=Streptomyces roseoverticillatus TaxID=66429 RepID=UPI0004C2904C|nr:hypothetical protein [Streptomyces roseoverticillatus]